MYDQASNVKRGHSGRSYGEDQVGKYNASGTEETM
jgi:hypothetical protein